MVNKTLHLSVDEYLFYQAMPIDLLSLKLIPEIVAWPGQTTQQPSPRWLMTPTRQASCDEALLLNSRQGAHPLGCLVQEGNRLLVL